MFGLNMIVHKGRTIFVGDTSVHEYPTSEQMAEIAISTAGSQTFGFDLRLLLYPILHLDNLLPIEQNIFEMQLKY